MVINYQYGNKLKYLPVIFEFFFNKHGMENTTMNRYGNPLVSRFYNKGYNAVDRDITSGRFVSKVKQSNSWISKVLNIFI